jgi:predicted RNase H-like HicB family nuclease
MKASSDLLNRYTRVVRPDDNGTFVAYLPAIPSCHAIGDSPAEAEAELENVFGMIVEEYAEQGRPLPPDVPVLAVNAR